MMIVNFNAFRPAQDVVLTLGTGSDITTSSM